MASICSKLLLFWLLSCLTFSIGFADPDPKQDELDEAAIKLQRTADQIFITTGIGAPVPIKHRTGFFCVAWGTGFPVMTALYDGREMPAVVAGRLDNGKRGKDFIEGRIVAFGHDAALDHEPEWNTQGSPRSTLFRNVFAFAGTNKKDAALMLWDCYLRTKTMKSLQDYFTRVDQAYISPKHSVMPAHLNLTDYNVIVVLGQFTKEIVPALREFVGNGGGLIQAATNWWHGHKLNGKMTDWAPRSLMQMAGLKFRANPYYHTQGAGGTEMISARGQFEGGCDPLYKEVI